MQTKHWAILTFVLIGMAIATTFAVAIYEAAPDDNKPSVWPTLSLACNTTLSSALTTDQVAQGELNGVSFRISYPPGSTLLSESPADCTAMIKIDAAGALLDVNGYGYIEPYSFVQQSLDRTSTVDGLTIRTQRASAQSAAGNSAAWVSEVVYKVPSTGDQRVVGIITLEYFPGGSVEDSHYQALSESILSTFRIAP